MGEVRCDAVGSGWVNVRKRDLGNKEAGSGRGYRILDTGVVCEGNGRKLRWGYTWNIELDARINGTNLY